jgi:DNA gyrase subunit A
LISRGQGEYFVTTDNAQTLRFSDVVLRAQGRVGQGVAAMALGNGAKIVSASYLDQDEQNRIGDPLSLFVVTESGLGKKVPLSQYPQKGRATGGVITTELLGKDKVLLAMIVHESDHILLIWGSGESPEQVTALKASGLKTFMRARRGVALVNGRIVGAVKLGI